MPKLLSRVGQQHLGKNLGSSLLRHRYLSHKYPKEQAEEKKKDADLMMHSEAMLPRAPPVPGVRVRIPARGTGRGRAVGTVAAAGWVPLAGSVAAWRPRREQRPLLQGVLGAVRARVWTTSTPPS